MNPMISACYDLLSESGVAFAFCGGHALDIHRGKPIRPHGDIDVSAYWEDRGRIIRHMQTAGWTVYEACGNGIIRMLNEISNPSTAKLNLFCIRDNCPFFHVEPMENGVYRCHIDPTEQTALNYIEFLFNEHSDNDFLYAQNHAIHLPMDKTVLCQNGIPYLTPELVLLYKSEDITREENKKDFNAITPYLSAERKLWLIDTLKTVYPQGHIWIALLEAMTELWDVLDEQGNKTGRLHKRGRPLPQGDYHLVVLVWIVNSQGEFLISQRTPSIGWGGLWQQTGGCAVAGDDSLSSALREAYEELGIRLDPAKGHLFTQYRSPHDNDKGGAFFHVWLFKQDIALSAISLQPEETCDAMWATQQQIEKMLDEGSFIPREFYPYLDAMFQYCATHDQREANNSR